MWKKNARELCCAYAYAMKKMQRGKPISREIDEKYFIYRYARAELDTIVRLAARQLGIDYFWDYL